MVHHLIQNCKSKRHMYFKKTCGFCIMTARCSLTWKFMVHNVPCFPFVYFLLPLENFLYPATFGSASNVPITAPELLSNSPLQETNITTLFPLTGLVAWVVSLGHLYLGAREVLGTLKRRRFQRAATADNMKDMGRRTGQTDVQIRCQ